MMIVFLVTNIILLLPFSEGVSQRAGFTCLKDYSNSSLLHIDFRLDRRDDTVQSLYAYDTSTNNPLRSCKASTQDGGKIFQIRVTLNTENNIQTVPLDACGVKASLDTFELTLRSEASNGLVVATDRIYKCKCNSSESFRPWVETSGIQVGNVDLVNLTSTVKIKLEVVKAVDLASSVFVASLGDKVKFKFTMEYTSQVDGIDVVGARLKNMICSPSDTFSPVKRTLIDDNGCAVNHTAKVLSFDGPFTTITNGSSPFIAVSPTMEIGKFSDSNELNFLLHIEYCESTSSACFINMCIQRKKRSISNINTASFSTKLIISQAPSSSESTNKETITDCFRTLNFTLILSVVGVLLSLDGCVIVYLIKKLKSIPKTRTNQLKRNRRSSPRMISRFNYEF